MGGGPSVTFAFITQAIDLNITAFHASTYQHSPENSELSSPVSLIIQVSMVVGGCGCEYALTLKDNSRVGRSAQPTLDCLGPAVWYF